MYGEQTINPFQKLIVVMYLLIRLYLHHYDSEKVGERAANEKGASMGTASTP